MKQWFKLKLHWQIFVCILLGIGLGLILGKEVEVIKPVGDIFLRLLKMLIVPLTFLTITSGITRMEDLRSLRSLGGKTALFYLASSLLASMVGLLTALVINPGGEAIGLLEKGAAPAGSEFDLLNNIVRWVPENPLESMASGNMLQIILFALIIGIALLMMEKQAQGLIRLVREGADLMITVTNMVMKLAPYGILALVANMVATLDSAVLTEVGKFILTDYLAISFLFLITYPLILKLLGNISPLSFYRLVSPALLVAASTTSSAATLPVSMQVAGKNLKVPEKVWGFTLPLGATVNMDGMAAALGIISVFAANLYQLPITPSLILKFIFLGLALSIGTAGIKGGGIVISTALLQTLNLPLTLIPILAAVWPVLDIAHTTCNVNGDLVFTAILGKKYRSQ